MIDKLDEIETRYMELQTQLQDPDIMKDRNRYKELMQELATVSEIVSEYHKYKAITEEIESSKELIEESADAEMKEMAREELKELQHKKDESLEELKLLLIPKDPLDLKNIIMEIRAGTGGEEAALFVADLYRMYSRYAENTKRKIEILSMHETGIGGFKEIIFSVTGKNVYADLRYESGVHRVQRVPDTESGGRIHTSAVTVAVLPEAEETDIVLKPEDLRFDVFRSSGPGGQSVNTTDSAVRVTYLPTGMVVTCQDEKSQHKNKAKALRVLRARLYEEEANKKHEERAKERRSQVGSGDRSERIRTYNFPQNRMTDHRINLTLYKLEYIMEGDLTEMIDALKISAREAFLKSTVT
ncbi:MAG: peptide chain release factor 1 [Spirochaetales bacterium]|nr:peptide chain release factor 1 [Spirochaetales bacterium]